MRMLKSEDGVEECLVRVLAGSRIHLKWFTVETVLDGLFTRHGWSLGSSRGW